eukprot:TRINITY_DN34467_c0_g1_i1.p1 TRINITY_DN34467_c0_g1~~TRINITY_DN34467_c0_g1_i1.p1  ORF type:complete len:584 (+),score=150.08 TRINITY_DN34467_c0_g1_i1:27-1778(+)
MTCSCCLAAEETARYHAVSTKVLCHYARRGDDTRGEWVKEEMKKFYETQQEQRDTAVKKWAADARVYDTLPEEDLLEGCLLAYGVRGTFHIAEYTPTGTVLVRLVDSRIQVFTVRTLHGLCLHDLFSSHVGTSFETTLVQWHGEVLCLGIQGTYTIARDGLRGRLQLMHVYHKARDEDAVLSTLVPKPRREAVSMQYKTVGNTYFKKSNPSGALEFYKRGLRVGSSIDLVSNSCLMLFKMCNYTSMLKEAQKGLAIDGTHAKLLFRKAQALQRLELAHEARTAFEQIPEEDQVSEAGKVLMADIQSQYREKRRAGQVLTRKELGTFLEYLTVEETCLLMKVSHTMRHYLKDKSTTVLLTKRVVAVPGLPLEKLEILQLEYCSGVRDIDVSHVLLRCKGLRHLSLKGCLGVGEECVKELLTHCKLQMPMKRMLPGVDNSLSSLGGLPSLPGMTHDGGRRRRARHREVIFNSPIEEESAVKLEKVDLSYCDNVKPTKALEGLGLSLQLLTTCRPQDFTYEVRLSPPSFIVTSAATSEPDYAGRFHYFYPDIPFKPSPLGPFALSPTTPTDQAEDYLLKLGLQRSQ